MAHDHLLSNTDSLMKQMFWFQQTIAEPRAASHRGVAIKYMDLKEMRSSFILELKSTAMNWVYATKKYNELLQDELPKRGGDFMNALSYLQQLADHKFRKGCPQGQFGELLLFNFIQHFFRAPPLLRKMSITTNPAIERHGADAIHYKEVNQNHVFILGESKCYESKYKFNAALKKSVDSIFTSFENIEEEMMLYYHDDFIDPELRKIATDLKDGRLNNTRFELVCMVAYEETSNIDAASEAEIKSNIEACIMDRWKNAPTDLYSSRRPHVVDRINYVVFPAWGLDKLLGEF